MEPPKVLTIAGSDCCGGAGIAADLKTFQALGVYGMSIVTAVTAQNTKTFDGVLEIPPVFVALQIDSVMRDIGADAWKTGMLVDSKIIKVVVDRADRYNVRNLVVDPVFISKTGTSLVEKHAIKILMHELIPHSLVVTPNINEVKTLTGITIKSLADMRRSATLLHTMGARNVVIKGGHLSGKDAIDLFFDGRVFRELRSPRIKTQNTHGAGCTFASAIAAEVAKGKRLENAMRIAKEFVTGAMRRGKDFQIGKGNGPLHH